jgi:hypothetical protein
MVAMRNATAQPGPARPKTSGTVITGAPVGAMIATDCARVWTGDSAPDFRP